MKKLKAYYLRWKHFHGSTDCGWRKDSMCKNGSYIISEPWFRIGKIQFWRTIKIACLCGKVFYNIEDL
jgi:hypothetical protein